MLEHFPFHNFNKKIAVSLELWRSEQAHYQQQTAIKKRNFRLILGFILFVILGLGVLAILARPNFVFFIAAVILIFSVLSFLLIKILQKRKLSQWQARNNRLFAPALKAAIFRAFFDELEPKSELPTVRKVLINSSLYSENINLQTLDFQYEGFFNQEPLFVYAGSYSQNLSSQPTAFFNLSKTAKNDTTHFFSLKSQQLEPKNTAKNQEFGYFAELETQFNFYSVQRGALAAFIEKNEMILQRINNLQLNYLTVSVLKNKINCSFDTKLLNFWQEIEITKPLETSDLEHYYQNMSKLATLISLLQNLEISVLAAE